MRWELTLRHLQGWTHTQQHSHAQFYESTVVICWSGDFPRYQHIHSLQLYGVQRRAPKSRAPSW